MLNSAVTTLNGFINKNHITASTLLTDALSVMQKAEKETNSIEISYTQQKGIGAKPTLLAVGETLKTHTVPLKLHSSFCDPKKIIQELENIAKNREAFLYFQGESYAGCYIITKVQTDTISRLKDKIICAEMSIELLEAPSEKEDEEYKQQKKEEKQPQGKLSQLREKMKIPAKLQQSLDIIPDSIKVQGLGYLDDKSEGLASEALQSNSLLDVALRNTQSYLNIKTNGISEELLNKGGQLDSLIQ